MKKNFNTKTYEIENETGSCRDPNPSTTTELPLGYTPQNISTKLYT